MIRPVETVAEYRAVQQVQRRVWGITDESYLVPVATLISVQHAGGLVLGAFQGERLVGFSFGYLGRVRGQWVLYSQLTGVESGLQDGGVGGRLKEAQRGWARAEGLALVVWTFDPLQAGNARFNLHRLGARCRTYYPDYFGERTDALSAGLESDRLLAEWPVEDAPRAWRGDTGEPLRLVAFDRERGTFGLADAAELKRSVVAQLDIPPDLAALKGERPDVVRAWQAAVRAQCSAAFAAGYVAMDFVREPGADARAYYVLRQPAER